MNREYQPLGHDTETFAKQVDYEQHIKIKSITEKRAEKLSCNGKGYKEGRIYLYTDSCRPTDSKVYMEAYLERLSLLMKLKTEDQ